MNELSAFPPFSLSFPGIPLSLLSLPSYFLAQFSEWARLWNWSLGYKVVRLSSFSSPSLWTEKDTLRYLCNKAIGHEVWSSKRSLFSLELIALALQRMGPQSSKSSRLTIYNLQHDRHPQLTQEIHFPKTSDLWNLVSVWRISGAVVCHNQILSLYISSQATTVP